MTMPQALPRSVTSRSMNSAPDRQNTVMIVDDTPANLAFLSDALDDAGYEVLVALSGLTALRQLECVRPDLILLDAVMPGIDGFETCERLKARRETAEIPVIFMTALCETENIVRGFGQGAVDYLTKPVRKEEVLARISTHISRSRELRRAEQTVEALPRPSMRVDADGFVTWMSGRAQSIAPSDWRPRRLPPGTCDWLALRRRGSEGARTAAVELGGQRFVLEYCGEVAEDESLVFCERAGEPGVEPLLQAFGLTPREAEVLRWVAAGKTNRDIGEILGSSPRTVTKHLEHVFAKLGVETRTAAASRALAVLGPQLS